MGKRKRSKISQSDADSNHEEEISTNKDVLFSDELLNIKKSRWINKQRVMVIGARGITARDRHLMLNLRTLLPHSKSEAKLDSVKTDVYNDANEICESRNCNKCILFVNKKRKDSYMWVSNVPNGPSAKFLVENIHTMEELRMSGNCLKGSRPLLSFDPQFDKSPHLSLIKELFVQTFGTPNYHPKSQPFFDHVFTFTILDKRIWFRNYQIVGEEGSLVEIGPRFVLNLIRIFDSSFGGRVTYSNPNFINPNVRRRMIRLQASDKYKNKVIIKEGRDKSKPKGEEYQDIDPLEYVFDTIPPEQAKGQQKTIFHRVR